MSISTPDTAYPWDAHALWEQLNALLPGIGVKVVAQSDSTNTELLDLARRGVAGAASSERDPPPDAPLEAEGAWAGMVRPSVESRAFGRRTSDGGRGRRAWDAQPQLLVAEHQLAGRGRQGASWQSQRGASLTFSLMLPLAPLEWSGLSLAVGWALAQALDPTVEGQPPRIGLKWPNDLWLLEPDAGAQWPGRKLGGVLIETVASDAQRMVVVGVGLNLSVRAATRPAQLNVPAAGLDELMPGVTPPQALAKVALPLVQALLRFEREGWSSFAAAYAQRDVLLGRAVSVLTARSDDGGSALQGVAQGVAPDGGLRLSTPEGEQRIISGEVSIRLAGAASSPAS